MSVHDTVDEVVEFFGDVYTAFKLTASVVRDTTMPEAEAATLVERLNSGDLQNGERKAALTELLQAGYIVEGKGVREEATHSLRAARIVDSERYFARQIQYGGEDAIVRKARDTTAFMAPDVPTIRKNTPYV